eukprot:175040-Rhodomonas_salina.2
MSARVWVCNAQCWDSVCCYDTCSTAMAYPATRYLVLTWSYATYGTEIARDANLLRHIRYYVSVWCYAMYGAEVAYTATR